MQILSRYMFIIVIVINSRIVTDLIFTKLLVSSQKRKKPGVNALVNENDRE